LSLSIEQSLQIVQEDQDGLAPDEICDPGQEALLEIIGMTALARQRAPFLVQLILDGVQEVTERRTMVRSLLGTSEEYVSAEPALLVPARAGS